MDRQLCSLGIQPLNDQRSAIAHRLDDGILAAYIDDVKTQASAFVAYRGNYRYADLGRPAQPMEHT